MTDQSVQPGKPLSEGLFPDGGMAPRAEAAGDAPGIRAPLLLLPDLFDPALCADLRGEYERNGGEVSGFMVLRDGRTVARHDPAHKRRRDHLVMRADLIAAIHRRIVGRVVPAIRDAFCFAVTRMERNLVACYDAAEGGHFRAHRDNTTPGTAHRRFALSVSLNDDFEGGGLTFPQFGEQSFRAPAGGGVVFSCSLLHQVQPVTRGRRYVFLPFLYDEPAAEIRRRNQIWESERNTDPGPV